MTDHHITVLKKIWDHVKILCLLRVSHWMLNPLLASKQNPVYQVPFSEVRSVFINVPFIPSLTPHPNSISCHRSRLLPWSIQREWHLDPSCVPVSRNNICRTFCFKECKPFISEFFLCFSALHQNYRYRESSRWVCLSLNMNCAFVSYTKPWILVFFLQHKRAVLV